MLEHPTNSIHRIPGAGDGRPLRYSFLVVGTAKEGTSNVPFTLDPFSKKNTQEVSPRLAKSNTRDSFVLQQLRQPSSSSSFFTDNDPLGAAYLQRCFLRAMWRRERGEDEGRRERMDMVDKGGRARKGPEES